MFLENRERICEQFTKAPVNTACVLIVLAPPVLFRLWIKHLRTAGACVALAHRSSVFILSVYKVLRVSASLADKMEINPHPSLCSCLHTQLHQYLLYYLSTTLQTALMSIWNDHQAKNAPHDLNSNSGTTATPSHTNFHAKLSSTSHGPLLRKHKLWHSWWGNVSNLSLGNDKIVVNYNFTLFNSRPPPSSSACCSTLWRSSLLFARCKK